MNGWEPKQRGRLLNEMKVTPKKKAVIVSPVVVLATVGAIVLPALLLICSVATELAEAIGMRVDVLTALHSLPGAIHSCVTSL